MFILRNFQNRENIESWCYLGMVIVVTDFNRDLEGEEGGEVVVVWGVGLEGCGSKSIIVALRLYIYTYIHIHIY